LLYKRCVPAVYYSSFKKQLQTALNSDTHTGKPSR
jgi:hypothetical protein